MSRMLATRSWWPISRDHQCCVSTELIVGVIACDRGTAHHDEYMNSRRILAMVAPIALLGSLVVSTNAVQAAPSASCKGATALVQQTQGPYYKPNAPIRTNLRETNTSGTPLTLTGTVLNAQCAPIKGAKIEFWQADGQGVYDNSGYALRGTQLTNASGQYALKTVIPGQYPGRTEHIHVKITPPGKPTLTTQLYFPGAQANAADGIFSPSMVLTVTKNNAQNLTARFNFITP